MRLAAIFSDHMVLQRDRENHIFGETKRDTRITLSIDDIRVSRDVKAGSFCFSIPAHKKGGPYEMIIECSEPGRTVKVIHDVLYGEVWLANGQSNIELELQNADGGKQELKNASFPDIRYFKVIKAPVIDDAVLKQEETQCWHKLTDGDFAEMSGLGYYYAARLHELLEVPVGMIDCYQGGTSISCWLKRDVLSQMPEGRIYLEDFEKAIEGQTEEDYVRALNEYNALVERHLSLAAEAELNDPGISAEELERIAGCYPWPPPMGLKSVYRPGGVIETMMERVAPYTVKGILYYQGEEDTLRNFQYFQQTHENTMYENLLVRLIGEYRTLFYDPNLPVCILQLPMFLERNSEDIRDWAYLRKAQETAVERIGDPNAMLVSLIDCGEYGNVHPVDKKTPGRRTAEEVLAQIYKEHDPGAVDMTFKDAQRDSNDIILYFNNTYGAIITGENELSDLRGEENGTDKKTVKEHIFGFEAGPDDESFSVPDCVIEGDHIRLKDAAGIRLIRYGFFNYGKVNLYNGRGMPLRPFSIEPDSIDDRVTNQHRKEVSVKKEYTIGFLVSGIMDEFTEFMARGIMNAIGSDDPVRLLVVPVKYIDRDLTGLADKYEYQYKTMAGFVTEQNVDALIVAKDCIGCLTNTENIMRFMKSLGNIPTVLIASKMDGYPGVTFDNRSGIEEGLNYLIENLGVKKLCMLGGDSNNSDAMERKGIFAEVLNRHGIDFRDSMYVGSLLTSDVREEAGRLLDQNPDTEAVFCVNDEVAFALYEELRSRGLEPGRDVKVMGFDNSQNSAMVVPSLSTVNADAEELGRYAYHMAWRVLCGEKPGEETIPTRFIRRDSFGIVANASEDREGNILNREDLPRLFSELFYRSSRNPDKELERSFMLFMSDLIDYVTAKEHDGRKLVNIENEFELFLSNHALTQTDTDTLILYIEKLQSAIMNAYGDSVDIMMVYETTDHVYKRLLKHLGNETVRYEEHIYGVLQSMKTLVKDSLNFTYGNDLSYSTALGTLNMLDIKNAYFYVYEKPVLHLEKDRFKAPKTMRLKAAMNDGAVTEVPYNMQRTPLSCLFDNSFIKAKSCQMVLMPLYFGDTLYGVLLCDLNDSIFVNGEFLANQLATTARMIDILKMNNDIQKQLEENLAVMAQNNIELDKLSKNDVLTGILNRRGFYQAAEEMLDRCRMAGETVILSYVDMNNLKIINDRFGHDDGDHALKTTSRLLTQVIGSDGIVARIGGDEYAFAYNGKLSADELSERIENSFSAFNSSSDREYNVTVSSGFFRVLPTEDITLEDAMALADQDLYIAKQKKDNKIFKEAP